MQAFAAGAALCSTSLGTTFTVLSASGLSASRLGVVLTSAAMMDDVVGLVMVQVISNLGGDNFSWVTVVRPVLVSVAFAVIVPPTCLLLVKPLTLSLNRYRETRQTAGVNALLQKSQTAFVIHTLILIGLVTGATYAGTSNLFAAYIAGASISWWDSEVPHTTLTLKEPSKGHANHKKSGTTADAASSAASAQFLTAGNVNASDLSGAGPQHLSGQSPSKNETETGGAAIYERYYHSAVSKILQPLFFASVGFSIPITRMFNGAIVWRGVVYTALMAFGKLVCGLWLVRFTSGPGKGSVSRVLAKVKLPSMPHMWGKSERASPSPPVRTSSTNETTPATSLAAVEREREQEPRNSPSPPKPFSLHPPLILALAMCARGEIGFLISGVAESNGIFSVTGEASQEPSDIFLVVTWAIVLCTILGPLGVGLSVRRVKKLQARKNKQQEGTGRDVLGVWGVE